MKTTKTKSKRVKETEVDILRDVMLFTLSVHKWGNRTVLSKKEKTDEVQTKDGVDKDELHITKRLLKSPKLDAVAKTLDAAQAWCISRSMISNIRKGVYLVKRSMIEEFEAKLEEVNNTVVKEKMPEFLKDYDDCKKESKKRLGVLFSEEDYPSKPALQSAYYMEWNWFGLSVPDELPEEVRKREVVKLKETYRQAAEEAKYALREGLKKLVAHAVERLEVKSGQEPKVLRDKSLVGNFKEFFDTFSARDLTNDVELAKAMESARKVVDKFDPDAVRESVDVRNEVAAQFDKVNKQLDDLLVDRPVRKFKFDQD